jgi:nicotinate-nucleotide pyrophosphorylase (carboxylating)
MLDNLSIVDLEQAVAINQGRAKLEASGNVSETTLAALAATGVDYISIGALTKHVTAIDLSMRFLAD